MSEAPAPPLEEIVSLANEEASKVSPNEDLQSLEKESKIEFVPAFNALSGLEGSGDLTLNWPEIRPELVNVEVAESDDAVVGAIASSMRRYTMYHDTAEGQTVPATERGGDIAKWKQEMHIAIVDMTAVSVLDAWEKSVGNEQRYDEGTMEINGLADVVEFTGRARNDEFVEKALDTLGAFRWEYQNYLQKSGTAPSSSHEDVPLTQEQLQSLMHQFDFLVADELTEMILTDLARDERPVTAYQDFGGKLVLHAVEFANRKEVFDTAIQKLESLEGGDSLAARMRDFVVDNSVKLHDELRRINVSVEGTDSVEGMKGHVSVLLESANKALRTLNEVEQNSTSIVLDAEVAELARIALNEAVTPPEKINKLLGEFSEGDNLLTDVKLFPFEFTASGIDKHQGVTNPGEQLRVDVGEVITGVSREALRYNLIAGFMRANIPGGSFWGLEIAQNSEQIAMEIESFLQENETEDLLSALEAMRERFNAINIIQDAKEQEDEREITAPQITYAQSLRLASTLIGRRFLNMKFKDFHTYTKAPVNTPYGSEDDPRSSLHEGLDLLERALNVYLYDVNDTVLDDQDKAGKLASVFYVECISLINDADADYLEELKKHGASAALEIAPVVPHFVEEGSLVNENNLLFPVSE